jgi:hypothetical protein
MDAIEKLILRIFKEDMTVINEEKAMFHLFFHACHGYREEAHVVTKSP